MVNNPPMFPRSDSVVSPIKGSSAAIDETHSQFNRLKEMLSKIPLPEKVQEENINGDEGATTPRLPSRRMSGNTRSFRNRCLSGTSVGSCEPRTKTPSTVAETTTIYACDYSDSSSCQDSSQREDDYKHGKQFGSLKQEIGTGYLEKRCRHNAFAERSRDSRRLKDERIMLRAVYLQRENLRLKAESVFLQHEIEKLKCRNNC